MAQTSRELCLVWGAPLSGQKRWILRSCESTESPSTARALFVSPDESAEVFFKRIEEVLGQLPEGDAHVYCELPWHFSEEGWQLEEWLSSQPAFQGTNSPWQLSFAGLVTADAARLSKTEKARLEEFARASQSSIVVLQGNGEGIYPEWAQEKSPDFGKRIEIFEEAPWEGLEELMEADHEERMQKDLERWVRPVAVQMSAWDRLMQELLEAKHGHIFGAELWGVQDNEFVAYTLTQSRVFRWKCPAKFLIDPPAPSLGSLEVAGEDLDLVSLRQTLAQLALSSDA